ncbi:MAG TPA: 4-hydroxybenzoate octaprenyltransferase [Alphaproteobacteria bacterium]
MSIDLQQSCWFDRFLPRFARPYARLARWDRPIGFWLLFWPCVWGLLLAPGFVFFSITEQAFLMALFLIGSIAMRGAGCTINDIWDRKLDAQVARTASRPLAAGTITLRGALIFLLLQCLGGLAVLYFLPLQAQIIALLYVPLIVIYPLMKRITMWPQAFLAIVFNAGAIVGWAATDTPFDPLTWILYGTCMLWTLGYDTLYAHMDQTDDALIGIKSTVIRFGDRAVYLVAWCWAGIFAGWLAMGLITGFPLFSWLMFTVAMVLQIMRFWAWAPENDKMTLNYFKYQHAFGGMLALACWYNLLNHLPVTG